MEEKKNESKYTLNSLIYRLQVKRYGKQMMTNDLETNGKKILFTERAISGSTLLGGPLAGIYLIAHNFREIGNDSAARLTRIIGIISIVIMVPLQLSIPHRFMSKSLSLLFYLLWVMPAYHVVKMYQREEIDYHLSSGGKKGSAWKAAGIGFLAMIVFSIYVIIMSSLVPKYISPLIPKNISPLPHFKAGIVQMEYSGCKVYYDSTVISQSDAQVAGAVLEKVGYFTPSANELGAVFYKMSDKYTIAFAVNNKMFSNIVATLIFENALEELKETYGNRKYQFRLLDVDSTGIKDEKFYSSD